MRDRRDGRGVGWCGRVDCPAAKGGSTHGAHPRRRLPESQGDGRHCLDGRREGAGRFLHVREHLCDGRPGPPGEETDVCRVLGLGIPRAQGASVLGSALQHCRQAAQHALRRLLPHQGCHASGRHLHRWNGCRDGAGARPDRAVQDGARRGYIGVGSRLGEERERRGEPIAGDGAVRHCRATLLGAIRRAHRPADECRRHAPTVDGGRVCGTQTGTPSRSSTGTSRPITQILP